MDVQYVKIENVYSTIMCRTIYRAHNEDNVQDKSEEYKDTT